MHTPRKLALFAATAFAALTPLTAPAMAARSQDGGHSIERQEQMAPGPAPCQHQKPGAPPVPEGPDGWAQTAFNIVICIVNG